jgi:hypothetical protein
VVLESRVAVPLHPSKRIVVGVIVVDRSVLRLTEFKVYRRNACEVLESCEVAAGAHGAYVAVPKVSHRLTGNSLVRALHLSGDLVNGLVEERCRRDLKVRAIGSNVDIDVRNRCLTQPRQILFDPLCTAN